MGIAIVLIFLTSVAIGVEAQAWKGRTDAAWGFLTLLFLFSGYLFVYLITYYTLVAQHPGFFGVDGAGWLVLGIFTSIFGGGFSALIVATLPNKKNQPWR